MTEKTQLFLDAYKTMGDPPKLQPGGQRREWMDKTLDRFAYRCLPLTMANSTGWELLCPYTVELEWNGGPEKEDLRVTPLDRSSTQTEFASSHFKTGIATFHPGYLFKTPPGWGVWCMGPPNLPKDGVYPLSGLIETDWLPFSFTMNWQMTRPGKVRFEKGEPFCFVTLIEHGRLDAVQPIIRNLSSNKILERDYNQWVQRRNEFNFRLDNHDEGAIRQGWQRHYMKGDKSDGTKGDGDHKSKRKLKKPRDVTGSSVLMPKK